MPGKVAQGEHSDRAAWEGLAPSPALALPLGLGASTREGKPRESTSGHCKWEMLAAGVKGRGEKALLAPNQGVRDGP